MTTEGTGAVDVEELRGLMEAELEEMPSYVREADTPIAIGVAPTTWLSILSELERIPRLERAEYALGILVDDEVLHSRDGQCLYCRALRRNGHYHDCPALHGQRALSGSENPGESRE